MRVTGQHITSKKWVFHVMLFAFFWLLIGDLITLHERVIYGFEPFKQETPFTKTDNTAHKTITIDKGSKICKFKTISHFDFAFLEEQRPTQFLIYCAFVYNPRGHVTLSQIKRSSVALRAPPLV